MNPLSKAKCLARDLRRTLGFSPMQAVLRKLRVHGVPVSAVDALEVFGCDGNGHVKDYANQVASLEVWDISPGHEPLLRRNFPAATVRICDSYRELQSALRRYGLIVIDNSPVYRPHIEHFDLFGSVLNAAADKLVLVVNIIPEVNDAVRRRYPVMAEPDVIARRSSFYSVPDGASVSLERIVETYESLLKEKGFVSQHWFVQRRNAMVLYLTLIANRSSIEHALNGEHERRLL